MILESSFPGGVAVDVRVKNHTIRTDQPEKAGGEDSAPAPFDLFLASIVTCAGFYAVSFCQQREIPTDGLAVRMETIRDPDGPRIGTMRIEIDLPAGFPEKYRKAILRAVDQCAVKRHILEPPSIEVVAH